MGRHRSSSPIRSSKGRPKPFAFEREYTPPRRRSSRPTRERHLAFTVRWTGIEPGTAGELAALALDRAQSASEFRAALARWKMPAVDVRLRRGRRRGRPSGGGDGCRSGRLGRRAAGAGLDRGVRVAGMASARPSCRTRPCRAAGGLRRVGQSECRANEPSRANCSAGAPTFARRRLQAASARHARVERRAARAAARRLRAGPTARSRRAAGCSRGTGG